MLRKSRNCLYLLKKGFDDCHVTLKISILNGQFSDKRIRVLKRTISARKEKESGKRVLLKNTNVASVEEIFKQVEDAESETNDNKKAAYDQLEAERIPCL